MLGRRSLHLNSHLLNKHNRQAAVPSYLNSPLLNTDTGQVDPLFFPPGLPINPSLSCGVYGISSPGLDAQPRCGVHSLLVALGKPTLDPSLGWDGRGMRFTLAGWGGAFFWGGGQDCFELAWGVELFMSVPAHGKVYDDRGLEVVMASLISDRPLCQVSTGIFDGRAAHSSSCLCLRAHGEQGADHGRPTEVQQCHCCDALQHETVAARPRLSGSVHVWVGLDILICS
ncbi:hypothetical protein B0T18DRAFT_409245 [Schizothecium vesticola]|uniref:Uncharacterized protein n=1 Tax=Schizothecium vesticola TaxID=314040 RepID=A0AA40F3P1_9PEZI|nr:hypothetical protein B0T18DRAFT_409245 [Schizothecium vesticola]